jgi:large subunit ribosomal protein L23
MSKDKKIALHLYDVIKRPIVTEKSQRCMEQGNQYTFEVCPTATKSDIKAAVEALFEVSVESVNTMNKFGKNKTFRGRTGRRQDSKKAVVRLAQGQSIAQGAGA